MSKKTFYRYYRKAVKKSGNQLYLPAPKGLVDLDKIEYSQWHEIIIRKLSPEEVSQLIEDNKLKKISEIIKSGNLDL